MSAHAARYLLRFDDLCPTHDRERWQQYASLVAEYGVRPILAIVPDNRDPALAVNPPDPGFWSAMRAMQDAGAAIGLHGYRHLCESRGRSLVPLHRETEFAGVGETTQREWIRSGLAILRSHRLNPTIWVAPRHGFDRATLRALRAEGLTTLSDGLARRAFLREGVVWIPQQLWAPVSKSAGLWTICIHANTATGADFERLRSFLSAHAAQFTSVERVLADFDLLPLTLSERARAAIDLKKIHARNALKLRRKS